MSELTDQVSRIAFGVVTGAAYATLGYLNNRSNRPAGDEKADLNWTRLGATLLVGAAVGGVIGAGGETPTPDQMAMRMAALGGVIYAVQKGLGTLFGTMRPERDPDVDGF